MTHVLIDSNVLIDIAAGDATWGRWSKGTVARLANEAILVINPIVYAEVSADFDRVEEVEASFPPQIFRREALPHEAAFLAGRCHRDYRRRGGARSSILPGFLIGAHAAIKGYSLLTRDTRRFRTYVPRLRLITPE